MKTYIVGNWKMNFSVGESSLYLHKLLLKIRAARGLEVVVAPSLVSLQSLSLQTDRRKIKLAAQNFFYRDFGAYTGEVSVSQLRSLVDYAIVGHSERRYIFKETDKDVRNKVAAALRNGITPILCVGETESERTFGETADVIRDMVLGGLSEVSAEDVKKVILAYEPVWAISGSGRNVKPASPLDVKDVFSLIRETLKETYGKETAEETPLLFGGSVSPDNAGGYLSLSDCNGLLIGGASLIAPKFIDIIEEAKRLKSEK
ncbi:triose-phosphate isomerase [Candidatus Saccharibacteria bacterium]|nr:triose-phosphate isomerase [Candidatus Saccharibacteria bacterium]MBQ6605398.1 triose-phosphate isomerase [Candidatus Saccharibacteria bacterium]